MNFITYINRLGSVKIAPIDYNSVDITVITQNTINEDFLVTSVFVDGIKRNVNIENAIQLAVINDNNFDGSLLDVNNYSVGGGYFSAKLLALASSSSVAISGNVTVNRHDVDIKSSVALTVSQHNVDVKSMPVLPYRNVYSCPVIVPVFFLSGAGSLSSTSQFLKLSMEIRLYTDGTNGLYQYDTYNNVGNYISISVVGAPGLKFPSVNSICRNGHFIKASTTYASAYNVGTYWQLLFVVNIATNEYTVKAQKYVAGVLTGLSYDLHVSGDNALGCMAGGFVVQSPALDVTVAVSKDYF